MLMVEIVHEVDMLYEDDDVRKRLGRFDSASSMPLSMGMVTLVMAYELMKRACARENWFSLTPANVRSVVVASSCISFKCLEDEAPDTPWWSLKFPWWKARCESAFAAAEGWNFFVHPREWTELTGALLTIHDEDERGSATTEPSTLLSDDEMAVQRRRDARFSVSDTAEDFHELCLRPVYDSDD